MRNAGHSNQGATQRRFGAFAGVFLPSLLSILGIILYLRLGWVVGSAGLQGALLILVIAHLISGLTSLSIASLATSRTVGVGGAYYIVSRALGAPAGIAIGLPLYFSQALSVGFYLVGFAQVMGFLVPGLDPRLSGSLALGGLALVTLLSTDLGVRLQYLVAGAILLSLLSLFTGPSPGGDLWPGATPAGGPPPLASLVTVFAVFFPAVTGVMAGVGMSGDIRKPRRDLPLGVLGATATGFLIYGALILLLAGRADNNTLTRDLFIAWHVSRFPTLITLGVLAAALSSALGGLLAAPRTLQAMAADGFAPARLAAAQGPTGEPRWALLATLGLAEAAVLMGDLNQVATLLTLFFLVTYGVVNLACLLETWAANPGFRPGFRVPWPVSALGALLCLFAMAAIHLPSTLLALLLVTGLYLWAARRHSRVHFGDDRFGIMAALVRLVLTRLQRVQASPGGWRPNLLVFSAATPRRSFMLKIAVTLVRDSGMVTLMHLLEGDPLEQGAQARQLERRMQRSLALTFPTVFCRVALVERLFPAIPTAVQAYGVGRFAANTVMLGWPDKRRHWAGFFKMWRQLLGLGKSVIVVHQEADRHAEQPRRMDLWWRSGAGNGAMLVLLGYLLAQHEGERNCRLRLLTAAGTEEGRRQARQALERMAQQAHTPMETQVFPLEGSSLHECIARHSRQVDLVMLGVHPPSDLSHGKAFMQRQADLLEELPTCLLISSAMLFEGREALFEEEPTQGDGEGPI